MSQLSMVGVPRSAVRTIAILAGLVCALLVSTTFGLAPRARAGGPSLKAVIIVGPTHSETTRYLGLGETWATRAEAQGMDVRRVFWPHATWANLKANIQGANLVVYLGHGNGWPSPYGPFQENTKDGFGLNSVDGGSTSDVKYYGGNLIRSDIKLAPNAVVVLSHACYSAGVPEPGMAYPAQATALERVSNFASAFLTVGAGAVFAYYHEQKRDMVADLMNQDATIDHLFKQPGTYDGNGFVAGNDVYLPSLRNPGATVHLDPSVDYSYIRAVTGNLDMTTNQWRGGASVPSDTTAPDLAALTSIRTGSTLAVTSNDPNVFTPNGDGLSDSLVMTDTLSESGYLDVTVKNAVGTAVGQYTVSHAAGVGRWTWDGRSTAGSVVPDGLYTLTVSPRDAAGNRGVASMLQARVMTALESPTETPSLVFARDGDSLAAQATLGVTVIRSATVSSRITDADGNVIRTLFAAQAKSPGALSWAWDGRNDARSYVADGRYYSLVTATTAAGTYSHQLPIDVAAFTITSTASSVQARETVTFTVTSAEPLSRIPAFQVTQPGLPYYYAAVTQVSATTYSAQVTFRPGGTAGTVKLRASGYDSNNRGQWSYGSIPIK